MHKELQLRLGVRNTEGARSQIWRVFTSGDHVYIALRDMACRQKISLHASRICRYAILDKLPLPLQMHDRCLERWVREIPSPKGVGAISVVFSLVFPAHHLSSELKSEVPKKEIKWIPDAPTGEFARLLRFGFTYEDEDFIRCGFSDDIIAYHRLPSGEAFVIMSSIVHHESCSFFLAHDNAHPYDLVFPPFSIEGYDRDCEMSPFFKLEGEAHVYSFSGYKMPIGSIEKYLTGSLGIKRHLIIDESAA